MQLESRRTLGDEPLTPVLGNQCSILLSYRDLMCERNSPVA